MAELRLRLSKREAEAIVTRELVRVDLPPPVGWRFERSGRVMVDFAANAKVRREVESRLLEALFETFPHLAEKYGGATGGSIDGE